MTRAVEPANLARHWPFAGLARDELVSVGAAFTPRVAPEACAIAARGVNEAAVLLLRGAAILRRDDPPTDSAPTDAIVLRPLELGEERGWSSNPPSCVRPG